MMVSRLGGATLALIYSFCDELTPEFDVVFAHFRSDTGNVRRTRGMRRIFSPDFDASARLPLIYTSRSALKIERSIFTEH